MLKRFTRFATFPAVLMVLLLTAGQPTGDPLTANAAIPGSLPSVSSGARPGPDVLYAPAPVVPQLENRHARFNAAPLLVSGQEAYIDGEYLYQDYIYDDYGSDTNGSGGTALSPRRGDINYPTNTARYGGNAADIVEFRIDVGPTSVLYRITLNTLLEADSTIIAIAFDTDLNALTGAAAGTLPRDPGAPFPGTDEAITIWGMGAEHTRFDPLPTTTTLSPTVDVDANQITVEVPRTVSNPTTTWRTTVASGLYDTVNFGWLRPITTASMTQPGGAGALDQTPAGIFNLAFRFDEPFISSDTPPDTNQALAIRNKTPTQYARNIDFAALSAGTDSTTVPASGLQIRIFPSRLQLGEGQDLNTFPAYRGQLQPYALYVPTGYSSQTPAGLVLALHSLSEHYWQYNGSMLHQQFGEQRGALVATSLSRGDDGWYQEEAEYDVFEMWNDVASHFTLDPEKVVLTGYSMGGYATYRLGTLYPDLFGKAFSVVGPPGDGIWVPPAPPTGGANTLSNNWLENARNLPYMNLAATNDELVPYAGTRAQNLGAPEHGIDGFDQHGYRFHFLTFETADHLALAVLGYDFPMAQGFLGDASIDRDPLHVTFTYMPAADHAPLGLVHDHAYWVSDLVLQTTGGLAKGTIDVFSHTAGLGDPTSTVGQIQCTTPGTPPECGPIPYTEVNRTWGTPPAIPVENRLDITLTNLSGVTIDAARAGLELTCRAITIDVETDADSRLLLAGPLSGASVSGAAFEPDPEGIALLFSAMPAGEHAVATILPSANADGDVFVDACDNCPTTTSEDQTNTDDVNETAGFERNGVLIAGDTLGDACDADDDNDGFLDVYERRIYGVSAGSAEERTPCRHDATVVDPWPPDFRPSGNPNFVVDTSEVSFILGFVGKAPGSPGYSVRIDLKTDNPSNPGTEGVIDTGEVSLVLGFVGHSCVSPGTAAWPAIDYVYLDAVTVGNTITTGLPGSGTLGPLDSCVAAGNGAVVNIDINIDRVPYIPDTVHPVAGSLYGLSVYQFIVRYDSAQVTRGTVPGSGIVLAANTGSFATELTSNISTVGTVKTDFLGKSDVASGPGNEAVQEDNILGPGLRVPFTTAASGSGIATIELLETEGGFSTVITAGTGSAYEDAVIGNFGTGPNVANPRDQKTVFIAFGGASCT